MSAFGGGFTLGTIDYGGKFLFHFEIGFETATGRHKWYQWDTARLTLVGSSMPARIPSRADLAKIAAYLDNRFGVGVVRHRFGATAQLEAYLSQFDVVPMAA
jgi:hypothetical protein